MTLKTALSALALASCALGAQAQVVTTLDYNLALSDGVFNGYFLSGQPCDVGTEDNRYRTTPFVVTAAGAYTFTDVGYYGTLNDGTMAVYSGSFNPAAPATGCVASVDDNATMTLAAGTYTLVMSSYEGTNGDIPGAFRYTVDGPAAVTFAAPVPTVQAVPTLSEWSLLLLAASAAGIGARRLRRRG